jgi:hypothetical protein
MDHSRLRGRNLADLAQGFLGENGVTDISMTGADLRPLDTLIDVMVSWRGRRRGVAADFDIAHRESLRLTEFPAADLSVLPGEAASSEALSRDKDREVLLELVRRFSVEGLSWVSGSTVKISTTTSAAATAFLQALNTARVLPKISPDGEGGLLLVWERVENPVLVVVEGWRLHLVTAAATPRATYSDDLPFDGEQIPKVVLDAIPSR